MIFYTSLFRSYLKTDDDAGNFTYKPLEINEEEKNKEAK